MTTNKTTNNNPNEIPLMFQAQIQGRGQIQYIGNPDRVDRWVDEWVEGAKNQIPKFINRENNHKFQKQEYKITWRFVSNSGQDEDIIRPVIATGGFPYYPGASMKGAFLRSCTSQQAKDYCGSQISSKETKPGILRFHGGYPKDDSWREQPLVDVVHPQQDWQIKEQAKHSAFIQISLYQPTLVFGISSRVELDETQWEIIWKIWESALEKGLGCRVSAGYGHSRKHSETKLLFVGLRGQGLASQLIGQNGTESGEFRPNMFKAALRGHTLRLFSGVTDESTAEELTKELWGGFAGKKSIVGHLGIAFQAVDLYIDTYWYGKSPMPVYELEEGMLNILCLSSASEAQRSNLKKLVIPIVKFSLLLGGFGKSWRRVDHRLVLPNYVKNNHNPTIGCHWEFTNRSTPLYCPVNQLEDITTFLNNLHNKTLKNWLKYKHKYKHKTSTNQVSKWREAWHPEKVEVWGRFAEDIEDSLAVKWFHSPYQGEKSIKGSSLTGSINKIGRMWHRMYPHYIKYSDGKLKRKAGKYIELLTIFPDKSDEVTQNFLRFLQTNTAFEKLW